MNSRKKLDIKKIRTYPLQERNTKSEIGSFAEIPSVDWRIDDFLKGLPGYLKAGEFRELTEDMARARSSGKARILMMGAHALKVGLSPIIIDLLKDGFISHLAVNGAVIIHDYEFAFHGRSSEDVAERLDEGMFGMVAETPEYLNAAVNDADRESGLGEVLGRSFIDSNPEHAGISVAAACARYDIPMTVHIAVGTDTIQQMPSFQPEKWSRLSYNDFLILSENCRGLHDGGVVINLGSAVILPEVFLKALNVARNVHGRISGFSAANIDMIQHYRPVTNVVNRPTIDAGKRYAITGHFEILLPLLCWALKTAE